MDWTCEWYVSFLQPECGEEAVIEVQTGNGRVSLCKKHKAVWNDIQARRRVEKQAG